MTKPITTIIVPVYNGEKYIYPFFEALQGQTRFDFEVIIVNDGSTDKTRELLNNYLVEEHLKFNLKVIHQKNAGVSAARNCALGMCTTEYIMFADIDDRPHENFVNAYVSKIKEVDNDICFFSVTSVDDEFPKNIKVIGYANEILSKKEASIRMLTDYGYGYLFATISKRKLWDNICLDENISFLEDEEVLFRVLQVNKKEVIYVSESYYDYVQRNDSAVHTVNIMVLENAVYATKEMINTAIGTNDSDLINIAKYKLLENYLTIIILSWSIDISDAKQYVLKFLELYRQVTIPKNKKVIRKIQYICIKLKLKILIKAYYKKHFSEHYLSA